MKIHQLPGYIQSVYLVEYPDHLFLLDGCCRADVDMIQRFITQTLSRPFTDLALVVVTHMHPDHAGGAHKLRKRCGAKIVTANVPGHWYKGLRGRFMHLLDVSLGYWVANRLQKPMKNLWYSSRLKADMYLEDLALLPNFSDWQVIFTPGHTDRDISVLHVPSQRIYVADMLVKVKNRFVPPLPVFHPNQYKASLNKLKALPLKSVMLAHSGEVPFSDINFDHLLTISPTLPRSTFTSTKNGLKQVLLRKRRNPS